MCYECKYFFEEPKKTEAELFCESLIRLGQIEYKPSIKRNLQEKYDLTIIDESPDPSVLNGATGIVHGKTYIIKSVN